MHAHTLICTYTCLRGSPSSASSFFLRCCPLFFESGSVTGLEFTKWSRLAQVPTSPPSPARGLQVCAAIPGFPPDSGEATQALVLAQWGYIEHHLSSQTKVPLMKIMYCMATQFPKCDISPSSASPQELFYIARSQDWDGWIEKGQGMQLSGIVKHD